MRSFKEAAELGEVARNARIASSRSVAALLWRMAREYQAEAARLDNNISPDIGGQPECLSSEGSS